MSGVRGASRRLRLSAPADRDALLTLRTLLRGVSVWRQTVARSCYHHPRPRHPAPAAVRLKIFRSKPGLVRSTAISLPVLDKVMKAFRISGPPQQMLVVSGSGIGTCRPSGVAGSTTAMPPL